MPSMSTLLCITGEIGIYSLKDVEVLDGKHFISGRLKPRNC